MDGFNPSDHSARSVSKTSTSCKFLLVTVLLAVAVVSWCFVEFDTERTRVSLRLQPSTKAAYVSDPSCLEDRNGEWTKVETASVSLEQTKNGSSAAPREDSARPILVPTTTSFADTSEGEICHDMLPWAHSGLSYGLVWNELRPRVLEASYTPAVWKDLDRFRDWVNSMFRFYTVERLRRSQAHPAPTASIRKILQLIQRRIRDPEHSEPIRIFVMGGSVTWGDEANVNHLELPDSAPNCRMQCVYADRLNHLLNAVLFPRHQNSTSPIFVVENKALPATNSQVGSMELEFEIIPEDPSEAPHVVIWSYSPNDSRDANPHETFQVYQQNFVRAAHNLRECDDDLPLVVLEDDMYGPHDFILPALEETGDVFKTASWFNLMFVAYSNVVRYEAIGNDTAGQVNPFFGSRLGIHLGMGFHMGVAWTLLFNLLGAMYDACSGAVEEDGAAVPSSWAFEELPTKYHGRYAEKAADVQQEWINNIKSKDYHCKNTNDAAPAGTTRPKFSTRPCTYVFMAFHSSGFLEADEIYAAFNHVLTENVGWGATTVGDGLPHERIAWLTSTAQATFSVELRNITTETNSLTVLSMKSYGPRWIDSKLRATVEVVPSSATRAPATEQFDIDGYHDVRTSVMIPHRFPIPGGIANVGDTIRAKFELVQGSAFKISGLAFCRLREVA